MPENELVTICIPTYNRAGMIGKAIESALSQSYKNIEIIVVDNASTDNTASVVASYSDDRLRYVRNDRNLGLFGNCNRCIELASGTYLHILHSDDFIDPDFTLRCVEFFHDHPTVVLTTTGSRIFCDNFEKAIPLHQEDQVFTAPEGFRLLLSARSFIVCPSVMVRRSIYQEVGWFSLEYPYSSDYYQWLKIARLHDIGFVSRARLYYRQGEHSETYRFLFSSPQGYTDMIRIFIQIKNDLGHEIGRYAKDLLSAQRRFIHDCIFAGFTRAEDMTGFSPLIFTGLSLTCWSLEKPQSLGQHLGKCRDFIVIITTGVLLSWSPLRNLINNLFFSKRKGY